MSMSEEKLPSSRVLKKACQRRNRLGYNALLRLESEFEQNPRPSTQVQVNLAKMLNIDEKQVRTWFFNQRRRKKLRTLTNGKHHGELMVYGFVNIYYK